VLGVLKMNLVTVDFKSNQIEVIEETQSIVVKDICEHIGLVYAGQHAKLKSDESYESKLIKVQTRGGLQEVFTIPLSKLNGWLFSINPNKVKPEVKQKLIEYKKECFNVLNNYFNNGIAVNHRASETDLQKILNQIEKQNQKIKQLENQLALQEPQKPKNPFAGFYENKNRELGKRENPFLYSRDDWMMLLNECETQLELERNGKSKTLLLSRGAR
jgi:hypothetical protein